MSEISYIDLFAGAGGLSEGFIRNGFKPLAHVEADKSAAYTLRTRTAYHYLRKIHGIERYQSYIKGDISRESLYLDIPQSELETVINAEIGKNNNQIFDKIDGLIKKQSVDLIIGGPPCQAYSVAGRARLKNKKDDERKKLYIQYGRFLNKYKPKGFVFENVSGLLSAEGGVYFKNLKKYYKRIGYQIEAKLLNARDYDVIQNRKRVIIIGWKKELDWTYPEIKKTKPIYFRDDIFLDLPTIKCGENKRLHTYSAKPSEYLNKTTIRNCVDYVSQHITRPHNEKDIKIYKFAIQQLNKGRKIKNNEIPVEMRTQKNTTSFLDRFKVVDDVPHTVIAHISKDGHHYIHPDIKQLRSISIREAARIQSFSDDYYFEGVNEAGNRSAAFKQIGNAVPPLMAYKIAEKIKRLISHDS